MFMENVKLELYMSMAYSDSLTDIKNRNAFVKEQEELQVDETVCYVIMDINGLKLVNALGHHYGEELIC